MYAGFWKRFLAHLLDYTILFVTIRLIDTLPFVTIGFVSAFVKMPNFSEFVSHLDDVSVRILGAIIIFEASFIGLALPHHHGIIKMQRNGRQAGCGDCRCG